MFDNEMQIQNPMEKHVSHWQFKCEKCGFTFVSEINKSVTVEIKIADFLEGEKVMEKKEEERYLGDIISTDGRNIKNINARMKKRIGSIVKNINNMIEGIPFRMMFFYKVALILGNSFLVSSILFNSEVWYNINGAELNLLETVDIDLLRKILKAPKSTAGRCFIWN